MDDFGPTVKLWYEVSRVCLSVCRLFVTNILWLSGSLSSGAFKIWQREAWRTHRARSSL